MLVGWWCPTLATPWTLNSPGSSVHVIFRARTLSVPVPSPFIIILGSCMDFLTAYANEGVIILIRSEVIFNLWIKKKLKSKKTIIEIPSDYHLYIFKDFLFTVVYYLQCMSYRNISTYTCLLIINI